MWENDLTLWSLSCIYEGHTISFQTFFVWALLLIVHTWNSGRLRRNLLRLQCTWCTVTRTSGRPHGSHLVWACQWPSSRPLSSSQLSHNESLWALGITKVTGSKVWTMGGWGTVLMSTLVKTSVTRMELWTGALS